MIVIELIFDRWHTGSEMVRFRRRLQCSRDRPAGAVAGGSIQLLWEKVLIKNCPYAC